MEEVIIYTDGACSGNPGPGGWAAILKCGEYSKEISGGERATTNNRMELKGVITALETLKRPCKVTIYTDSQYIVNAINKGWLRSWKSRGWKRKDGELKNTELWQRLDELLAIHKAGFHWVKGHDTDELNNRCDELAVMQRDKYSS